METICCSCLNSLSVCSLCPNLIGIVCFAVSCLNHQFWIAIQVQICHRIRIWINFFVTGNPILCNHIRINIPCRCICSRSGWCSSCRSCGCSRRCIGYCFRFSCRLHYNFRYNGSFYNHFRLFRRCCLRFRSHYL